MKKTTKKTTKKAVRFEIRPRDPTKVLTGANCQLFMDGKRLGNVTAFEFSVRGHELGKIRMELVGSVKVTGKFTQEQIETT